MRALIVIAKAPLPGFSKTRLSGEGAMSDAAVARLADAFLRDTFATCAKVAGVPLVVCFTPKESESYFRALAPDAQLVVQPAGDLGIRLNSAFDAAFEAGATRAVLIGMDTPHLQPLILRDAFAALDDFDCAIGPADDGGYYLIALRARCPELFRDIEWSTARVLTQSLERARTLGLNTTQLAGLFDIDDAASLDRLVKMLGPDGTSCPHTARVLGELRAAAGGNGTLRA